MMLTQRTHWKARVSCLIALILLLAGIPATATSDPETWSLTGPMYRAREGHTAVLLENGLVLVAGGFNGLFPNETELYHPITGTWTTTGSLEFGRRHHAATLLSDGRVMVSGGRLLVEGEDDYRFLASTEIYDPETGIWTPTGDMNIGRQFHTLTRLNDGRVLATGGYYRAGSPLNIFIDEAELYDPVTGTWTLTDIMNEERASHTATLLEDGKVLVAGGSKGIVNHKSAELYDPVTETWSDTGYMEYARTEHTATRLSNGQVLVGGGVGFSSAEVYDPNTGTWALTGSMSTNREDHTATRLSDGRVLVAGGYYNDGSDHYLNSTEIYDPATSLWTPTGSMNDIRRWHTATLLPDGRVLVVGGRYDYSHQLASAETYLPNWLPRANDDAYSTGQDTPLEVPAPGVLANDSDPDDDPLTAELLTPPEHGSVTLDPDGSFVYTPAQDYRGSDGFTYEACDDAGTPLCSPALVTITVSAIPANLPPVAYADAYAALKNTPLDVPAGWGVLANDMDPDSDPLIAILDTPPGHGALALNLDGSFLYTPNLDYLGDDGFTYRACDDAGIPLCSPAVVTITVSATPINLAPVANPDAYTTLEGTPLAVTAGEGILANDMDPNGDALTAMLENEPEHGAVTLAADGSFEYSPAGGYTGSDGFTYQACDDAGTPACSTAAVAVTVTPVENLVYLPVLLTDSQSR